VPETHVVFYQDEDGEIPVLEWLKQLLKQDPKGYVNCVARIKQLADNGYQLPPPTCRRLPALMIFMSFEQSMFAYNTAFYISFMDEI
jgi:hypothetical protein